MEKTTGGAVTEKKKNPQRKIRLRLWITIRDKGMCE